MSTTQHSITPSSGLACCRPWITDKRFMYVLDSIARYPGIEPWNQNLQWRIDELTTERDYFRKCVAQRRERLLLNSSAATVEEPFLASIIRQPWPVNDGSAYVASSPSSIYIGERSSNFYFYFHNFYRLSYSLCFDAICDYVIDRHISYRTKARANPQHFGVIRNAVRIAILECELLDFFEEDRFLRDVFHSGPPPIDPLTRTALAERLAGSPPIYDGMDESNRPSLLINCVTRSRFEIDAWHKVEATCEYAGKRFMLVLAPSGAGKTTFIRTVPVSSVRLLDADDVVTWPPFDVREKMTPSEWDTLVKEHLAQLASQADERTIVFYSMNPKRMATLVDKFFVIRPTDKEMERNLGTRLKEGKHDKRAVERSKERFRYWDQGWSPLPWQPEVTWEFLWEIACEWTRPLLELDFSLCPGDPTDGLPELVFLEDVNWTI